MSNLNIFLAARDFATWAFHALVDVQVLEEAFATIFDDSDDEAQSPSTPSSLVWNPPAPAENPEMTMPPTPRLRPSRGLVKHELIPLLALSDGDEQYGLVPPGHHQQPPRPSELSGQDGQAKTFEMPDGDELYRLVPLSHHQRPVTPQLVRAALVYGLVTVEREIQQQQQQQQRSSDLPWPDGQAKTPEEKAAALENWLNGPAEWAGREEAAWDRGGFFIGTRQVLAGDGEWEEYEVVDPEREVYECLQWGGEHREDEGALGGGGVGGGGLWDGF